MADSDADLPGSPEATAKQLTAAQKAKQQGGAGMGAGNVAQLQQKLSRMAFPSTGAFADGTQDMSAGLSEEK